MKAKDKKETGGNPGSGNMASGGKLEMRVKTQEEQ